MPTYAPTFTPRYRAHYICAGLTHSVTMRRPRGTSFAVTEGTRNIVHAVFDAVHGDLCSDFSWVDAEVALTDSDVFLPALVPDDITVGGNSLSDYSAIDKISAMTLSGKSAGGRSRFSIFGLLFLGDTPGEIGADGLVTIAEEAGLATILTAVNGVICGGDGTVATFHRRATFKPNDRLLRLVRRGLIG